MQFEWVEWSHPVAAWWLFLVTVSAVNIGLWMLLYRQFRRRALTAAILRVEVTVFLCAAYVFGCAFRSVLPRADVQRICLFDTFLSSIVVGRSVATIAEVCFVIQWAIVLRALGEMTKSDTVRNISCAIVPLILIAECFSWYAVLTTNFLGNAIENSLWAVSFFLILVALVRLLVEFHSPVRLVLGTAILGVAGYIAFLGLVDVPMYVTRWQHDAASGKALLDIVSGLSDAATRWSVTQDVAHWKDEMTWMALYFSIAVWSSLMLCGFELIKHRLPRYRMLSARVARSYPVSA